MTMRLSHKLKKLADPRTARSARQHLGRALLTRRLAFHVDAERIIASIDREGFAAIYRRHAVKDPGQAWPKYLDLKRWMPINLRRVRGLELDYGRKRRILDIGSGAGYFLYICKWFRHDVVGLDLDHVPMYGEMARLLGLKRVIWRIQRFVPLPDLGGKFDLITAFMICFNNHNRPDLWGVPEWDFFLADAAQHLKPSGRLHLEFNWERDGTFMSDELRKLFEARGATVQQNQVTFAARPRPLRLIEATRR
jgi:SAM-dependent methyltransferase